MKAKEDALAGAIKRSVLETSDKAGKSTITLYYKGRYLVITRKS